MSEPDGSDGSDKTMNRYAFRQKSNAEINALASPFAATALSGSDKAANRYGFGQNSGNEMSALPSEILTAMTEDEEKATMNRYALTKSSLEDLAKIPSFFSSHWPKLANDDEAHTMRSSITMVSTVTSIQSFVPSTPSTKTDSSEAMSSSKGSASDRYTETEIAEINGHPQIVSSNYVIGKRQMNTEELEDLRQIPSLCSFDEDPSAEDRNPNCAPTQPSCTSQSQSARTCSPASDS